MALDNIRAARAQEQAEQEPVAFEVGGWYKQQNGKWVQFVEVANAGNSNESMCCKNGIHRYTKRDFGRVTGTAHDYSYPHNTPPLYAAPVRTKDLTDIEYLQDAVTKALKKAFHLGQTYWQQADSESYAANKKADVTQELFFKLKDDTRAVIAADRKLNGVEK